MICEDLKIAVEEYGTLMEVVKAICKDKARTFDAIKQNLKSHDIEVEDNILLSVISNIEEMMIFGKIPTYHVGDLVKYWRYHLGGLLYGGEKTGNMIVCTGYHTLYLYNEKRFADPAFREYIFSKLKFEESRRNVVDTADGLQKALNDLNIEKDKWENYVVVDDKGRVFCKRWNEFVIHCASTGYLGEMVKTPSK